MKTSFANSANPLVAQIQKLFKTELALENDFLREENRILTSKLGTRVPLTETDRKILVKYGLRLKDRLKDVVGIVKPETLLAWHRRMKKKKWTFEHRSNIIPLGENHFRHVLKCIETHHNKERPHQGIDNLIPLGFDYPKKPAMSEEVCRTSSLGGLLNHYYIEKEAA